jgi:hypothetical protein
MLLHITNDDQLINWWKKWINFVKIKFNQMEILNDITRTLNQMNWNGFIFNWIKFKYNDCNLI